MPFCREIHRRPVSLSFFHSLVFSSCRAAVLSSCPPKRKTCTNGQYFPERWRPSFRIIILDNMSADDENERAVRILRSRALIIANTADPEKCDEEGDTVNMLADAAQADIEKICSCLQEMQCDRCCFCTSQYMILCGCCRCWCARLKCLSTVVEMTVCLPEQGRGGAQCAVASAARGWSF